MSIDSGGERPPTYERFVETQQVHLDLRRPPQRADAGIGPGRNSVIVERDRGGMLDVRFTLPDGRVFATPAIGVVFSSAPGYTTAPPEVEPSMIVVNRIEDDLPAAERALRADAALFGLDMARIAEFTASAGASSQRSSVELRDHDVGYLLTQVGIRDNTERVQIDYTFLWGPYADQVRALAATVPR